jgi:RNA polymerase sigma-70 factor (ECF subfamily)
MLTEDRRSRFVDALTRDQGRLYAYILTLMPDHHAASDILQNTNAVLWQKSDQFDVDSSFGAWSRSVAYYEVLAYRKCKKRDRHIFSDALLHALSTSAGTLAEDVDVRAAALPYCLAKLTPLQLEVVRRRYEANQSVKLIAREIDKSEGAVSQTLYRTRKQLAEYIEREVARARHRR